MANAKLKDELQLQSIGVDNLMQRFSHQAKHFQKMVRCNHRRHLLECEDVTDGCGAFERLLRCV